MTTSDARLLSRRVWEEIFSHGNWMLFNTLVASDIVVHDPGRELRGSDETRRGLEALRSAFPDLRYVIRDQIAEGDKVVVRFTGSGTHLGEFRGVAPTGRRMEYEGIAIQRFAEGKLVEHWAVVDLFGILQQLGAIPHERPSGE